MGDCWKSLEKYGEKLHRLAGLGVLGGVFAISYWAAFWLRFDGNIQEEHAVRLWQTILPVVLLKTGLFASRGWHRGWSRQVMFHDLAVLLEAASLGSLLMALGDYLFLPHYNLPRSVFFLDWGATVFLLGGARAATRLMRERYQPWFQTGRKVPTLIVSAGSAGEAMWQSLQKATGSQHWIVGFLDDSPHLQGQRIGGVSVLGTVDQTCHIAQRFGVREVLIPAGELPGRRLRPLMEDCQRQGLTVKVLPNYEQLLSGRVSVRPREVSIADLLHRVPAELDVAALHRWLNHCTVMVTGSAGSIGSEICRQLLAFSPARLVLVDQSESGQFYLQRELQTLSPSQSMTVSLADITHTAHLRRLMETHCPNVIFHVAAYKHVPLLEAHPQEAVQNNILATRHLADLAEELGTQTFVLISSDKAVNPRSVMGASKRVAELYVQALSAEASCRFLTVRFGNVLDSSGSVVPIFREQIRRGGPLTITHPDMQRYFMTIPEAAQLVLQSGVMGQGGELFVLDMGQPVRILDLARDMIALSGLQPEDIDLEFIGLRPGEKLTEELHFNHETHLPTRHPQIVVAQSTPPPLATLHRNMARLKQSLSGPPPEIIAALQQAVPEYQPTPNNSDLLNPRFGNPNRIPLPVKMA